MEEKLCKEYLKQRAKLDAIEERLRKHFNKVADKMLKKAKTKKDFIDIKERMRPMPDSVSKVLIFRKIIITEQKL